MRRVYVSPYTIYIDIYVLYVHMYMTNWKIGCALLVYWDFHLAKSNLCRGELLRCYRLTSWAAAILERRRDESIIPAAVLERPSSGRVYNTGREITFWHGEEHSHFQPEVVWKIYETRIFKTKNNNRFRVYPVGNPNGGIWGSVPSGESLRTGMSLLETRVARRRSGLSHQTAEEAEAKSIPKDTILPVLMISLCCFKQHGFLAFISPKFSTLCVFTRDENTELTIAISLGGLGAAAQSPTRFATSWRLGYLPFSSKEYHGWNSAMAIGLAQSAGDLSAALLLRVLPSGTNDGTSEVGFCRRIFMQPYNLSWLVLFWMLRQMACLFVSFLTPSLVRGRAQNGLAPSIPDCCNVKHFCSRFSSDPPATKGTLQFGDGKPLAGGSGYSASADGFPLRLQFEIHHRLKPFLLLGRQRSSPYDAGLVQDCPQRWGLFLQRCGPFDLFRGGWKTIWDQTGLSSSFFP